MKKLVLAASIAGVSALTYAGLGTMGATATETQLNALVDGKLAAGNGRLMLRKVSHTKGMFTSSGSLRLITNPLCLKTAEPLDLQTELHYTVNHAPGLDGMASFELSVVAINDAAEFVRKATGNTRMLHINGKRDFSGTWHSTISSPRISLANAGNKISIPASTGTARINGNAVAVNWSLPAATFSATSGAMQLRGMQVKVDLTDAQLGLGTMTISIDSLKHDLGRIEGIRFASSSSEQDGRIASVARPHIRLIDFAGQHYEDLGASLEVTGMDAASLRTLSAMNAQCDLSQISDSSLLTLEKSLLTLLDRGMRFAITDISARQPNGKVAGHFEVVLAPRTEADPRTFMQRLTSNGELDASGTLLPASQAAMLIGTGIARETDAGVSLNYALSAGKISINGEPDSAGYGDLMGMMSAPFEQMLSQWRDSLRREQPMLLKSLAGKSI